MGSLLHVAMRKLILLSLFLPLMSQASVDMIRINTELFINQPQIDFHTITISNNALKQKMVRYLFDHDQLNHEGTKAFALDAKFDSYYQLFQESYRLIDLDNDQIPELIFSGYVSKDEEKEHFEIYRDEKGIPTKIYDEIGHLLAYKIHPNTKETLLFHHKYPCCVNASHSINRLRLVGGKLQLVKRYFVAREAGDMKGVFFPAKTTFTGKFHTTRKIETLRWSGSIITKDAWKERFPKNTIARYASGSIYTILAEENGWYYVLMHTPPMLEENKVINPVNFEEIAVFGWLKKGV